jgi:hypothetical protein
MTAQGRALHRKREMAPINHRSGLSLVAAGAAGIIFFWATDPRSLVGRWLVSGEIDAANQALVGTIVGVSGSLAVLLLGLWLLTRRTV